MTDRPEERFTVSLPKADWRLIQEALDTELYESEHWEPSGFTKKRRARSRALREARMDRLMKLNDVIGQATGLGPL
jgi:hypothetical protein